VLRDYGIPNNKRTLVYDCIRPELLEVEPIQRSELGLGEDAELVFSAGALSGAKDFDNLVRSVPYFIEKFPNARVLIAGEGPLEPRIQQVIAELGLENVVTLIGRREDVANLMHTADLYASSSITEGLGTSVLEALACALPIVATDAGGINEMVMDGTTGYLVPSRSPEALGKAIAASLADRPKALAMAEAGVEHVHAHFLPKHTVEGMIGIYENLLGS
jgi:glycosyltransferase involved in cell wall biosynthesis